MSDANHCAPCCEDCHRNIGGSCTLYRHCLPWQRQYFRRQKLINDYAAMVLPGYYERQEKEDGGNDDHCITSQRTSAHGAGG